ncbi:uncharacterized protein EDB91DRAFT_1086943 [Suillus paluster]|uniref:uncharacterized protein n=1 Tax=Suillus paluster TaxID=48578 RepID=UPI001B875944|nr:uncharacterized protein EDB91DRAFT_1086943 [Suillus paluster]KAG1726032.1 hypothetical protein EDB91DRAFT_1086943 [Suillus paluster]
MDRYRQYKNTATLKQGKPWGHSRGAKRARIYRLCRRSTEEYYNREVAPLQGDGGRSKDWKNDPPFHDSWEYTKEVPSILLARKIHAIMKRLPSRVLHQISTRKYTQWLERTKDLLPVTTWYPGIATQGPAQQAARWSFQPKRTCMTPEPELFRRGGLLGDSVSREYRLAVTGEPVPGANNTFFAWDSASVRAWRAEEAAKYVGLIAHEEEDLEPRSLNEGRHW